MKMFRMLSNKKGIILPLALTYVLIFSAEIAGLSEYAAHTQRLVTSEQNMLRSFYLAEAATEKAVAAVRLHVSTYGSGPNQGTLSSIGAVPSISGTGVTYSSPMVSYYGGTVTKVLTTGDYSGLNGTVQTININVTATDTKNGVTHNSVIQQQLELQLIPIFQFGVFYQNDLEILPGANMTFSGPVHTNSNLYVGNDNASNSTSFQSTITAAGSIYHGRKDGGTIAAGAVNIQDGNGVYQNMNSGGTWLDSNSASWQNDALTRWGGEVKSSVHGVRNLSLPIPTSAGTHTLIERRVAGESAQVQAQKMDYKAHLRIIDGAVTDAYGNSVELRYCSGGGTYSGGVCPGGQTVVNPISTASYYNFREAKTMSSTDVNVGLLNSSPVFQTLVTNNNGVVVYFSDRRNLGSGTYQDVVRLTNGSTLPIKGLTVASENPLFVKGDYNTVSKKPAGIASDSLNVLSNNWNDAYASNTGLSNKTASNTTVNTAVITGNTTTTSGQYNGGFENLMRFHENWSGRTLTYTGSVACLYNSTIASGNWVYGGNYYTAPTRSWSFDTALADPSYNVPGFPSVYTVVKSSFESQ